MLLIINIIFSIRISDSVASLIRSNSREVLSLLVASLELLLSCVHILIVLIVLFLLLLPSICVYYSLFFCSLTHSLMGIFLYIVHFHYINIIQIKFFNSYLLFYVIRRKLQTAFSSLFDEYSSSNTYQSMCWLFHNNSIICFYYFI